MNAPQMLREKRQQAVESGRAAVERQKGLARARAAVSYLERELERARAILEQLENEAGQ